MASLLTIEIGGDELTNAAGVTIADDAITLSFANVASNVVDLTVSFHGGSGITSSNAKVNDIVFNIATEYSDLAIALHSINAVHNSIGATASYAANALNLSPFSNFDFLLDFQTSNQNSFDVGESAVFRISRTGGSLEATEFSAYNVDPNHDDFQALAHINDVQTNLSGKYYGIPDGGPGPPVVPEPASLIVWALIVPLGCVATWYRRRRQG
ncbi:MAG: hypothetical protein KDA60_12230 [Planctomycetales bacterium]|nr:hypothetical protein [Planctomycetales bacterium]